MKMPVCHIFYTIAHMLDIVLRGMVSGTHHFLLFFSFSDELEILPFGFLPFLSILEIGRFRSNGRDRGEVNL